MPKLLTTVVTALMATAVFGPASGMATPLPTPPPSVTSTPMTTIMTTVPVCRAANGNVISGLYPGGEKMVGCSFCSCSNQGEVNCYHVDCANPRCADFVKSSDCCYKCPNGNNCQTPDGDIVSEGKTLVQNGIMCNCTIDQNTDIWLYGVTPKPPQAQCSPVTCPLPDWVKPKPGKEELQFGEEWRSTDGCTNCRCDEQGALCVSASCAMVVCPGPTIRLPGVCCLVCSNTECETPGGQMLKEDQWVLEGKMNCSCTYSILAQTPQSGKKPKAECTPMAGCRLSNGTILEGKEAGNRFNLGPCRPCSCDQNWQVQCAVVDCAPLMCAKPFQVEGECCRTCPTEPTCETPEGKKLKEGEWVVENKMNCSCTSCILARSKRLGQKSTAKCTTTID